VPALSPQPPPRFAPRATLILVGAFALFALLVLLVALPALFEPLPPDAPPSALADQVKARLAGKIGWLFALSVALAALTQLRFPRR
jgi:hypothetical protein